MLQGLLVEPGRIELQDVDTPAPSEGELLIKIGAALTCGTDLKAYLRGHPVIPMPGPFGHEFSGTVAAAGKGVEEFREGDEVMAVHSAPCLSCVYCKRGLHNLCEDIMRTKALGAFAEYLLLPSRVVRQNTFRKPPGLPFEEAALLEPLSCVVHGVAPLGIRQGDSALVIGAGPIGLIHLMLLREASGGVSVAVADVNRQRLERARALGAENVIDPTGKDLADAAREWTPGGMGFDYVFECTGRPEVWEASAGCLRRGGTLVLFGGCPKGTTVTYDTYRLHYDEITLKGAFHYTPADVREARDLLLGGRLDAGGLISGRYPLRRIGEAFEKLAQGEGIKYAVIP